MDSTITDVAEAPPLPLTTPRSPEACRRRLALELRRRRQYAGLAIVQVAEQVDCNSSKISRIETGEVGAHPRDVRDMLALYGASPEVVAALTALAKQARRAGSYGHAVTAYAGLESAAEAILVFEGRLVPPLLQLDAYARAVLLAGDPEASAEVVDRHLAGVARLRALLAAGGPRLAVVLDESVLHRQVGGPAVTQAQLDHLAAATALPNVDIRILPFESGAHPGMGTGSFTVLTFADPVDPDVVLTEHTPKPPPNDRDAARYRRVFDRLQIAALSPEESARLVAGHATAPCPCVPEPPVAASVESPS